MADETSKLSVFLDADVIIAGLASTTGASHVLLQLSELGLLRAISSKQARKEVERNLEKKVPSALPVFRLIAEAALKWVRDPGKGELASFRGQADPEDLPILVSAIKSGCQYLVTFNVKDFRPKKGVIQVATPGDFLIFLRSHLSRLGLKDG